MESDHGRYWTMLERLCVPGAAALIKVCLAMEHNTLPGNLHYNEPNPNNASLVSGILQVSVCSQQGAASCSLFHLKAGNLHFCS